MFKQLEQRRSQLAFAEKKIGSFETRITELEQLTDQWTSRSTALPDARAWWPR